MKKVIYILTILAVAMASFSCSREEVYWNTSTAAEGAVSLNIGVESATRADWSAYPFTNCVIRIYSTDGEKTLVRKYTDIAELPSELWLVAGHYSIEVYLGEKVAQSWDKKYYFGETSFTVSPKQNTEVNVKCSIYNTIVRVTYGSSIADNFETGYRTNVMIGDKFDSSKENASDDGLLTYKKSSDGYFNLPSGENNLSFCFKGKLSKGGDEVHFEDTVAIDETQLHGYRHEIIFTYEVEDDTQGYIKVNVTVVPEQLVDDDIFGIDPDWGEEETPSTNNGVSSAKVNEWDSVCALRGIYTDAEGTAGEVKFQYCESGTESWQDLETSSEGTTYTAEAPVEPSKRYDYRLTVNGEQVGNIKSVTTKAGAQIPNAGFETWGSYRFSDIGDTKAILGPYTNATDQFWDTGNHGSATLNKFVTEQSSDSHSGAYSAYLNSQFVGVFTFGKFAAGNIFIGQYLGTNNTDGVIGFGKVFTYTFRPKQLKFYYKGAAGSIDQGNGVPGVISKGDTDVNEVYICLCNMGGPHIVDTRYEETFMNLENIKTISYCTNINGKNSSNDKSDGQVIAYGVWDNTSTKNEWTEITIDLTYNEEYEGVVPNYLMITASASKYGDYFTGSNGSEMYLDDFELVY